MQHISGQGDKWEVVVKRTEYAEYWVVKAAGGATALHIPCDEYRVCDPPEQWEDVTNECYAESVTNDRVRIMLHGENILRQAQEVRIRKIDGMHNGPAFIVERKKA